MLATQPTEGDHILVYLSFGFDDFIEQLKQFPNETFRVYGYDREAQDGNLLPAIQQGGVHERCPLQQSRDGHGRVYLMSEALWLKKPMLALPMAGQFEQQLNGYCLEQMGLGKNAPDPTQEAGGDFLYRLPEYRAALARHEARDNTTILNKLDELLADDCAWPASFTPTVKPMPRRKLAKLKAAAGPPCLAPAHLRPENNSPHFQTNDGRADIGRFILGPGKRAGGDELHVSQPQGDDAACCAARMASILSLASGPPLRSPMITGRRGVLFARTSPMRCTRLSSYCTRASSSYMSFQP